MTEPLLFDEKLLRSRRARFAKDFADANFLHNEIADRIVENISLLNRDFDSALEIEGRDDYLREAIKSTKNLKKFSENNLNNEQNESFDLIVSNLNLHHINLVTEFLVQIKNLLKPSGVFIASFFGEENLPELRKVLFEVENEIYGGISPRMSPRIDIKTAANLLTKAGFVDPISSLERIRVSYEEPLDLVSDIQKMGESNAMIERSKNLVSQRFFKRMSEIYRDFYGDSEGKITATFEIVIITGWKK